MPGLRTLGLGIFLPALLFSAGRGAIVPVVALTALDLGASAAVAGLVVTIGGLGQLAGDLPAGMLAARAGERRAMLVAIIVAVVSLVACLLATEVWMLAAAVACLGLSTAAWALARQSYLAEVIPYSHRARAMSTMGGVHRIGMFAGPFIGAAAMGVLGDAGAYWVHLVLALAAAGALAAWDVPQADRGAPAGPVVHGTVRVLREHFPALRTLGVGVLLIGAVRMARQAVVPLWAAHIGLDAATTSLIFGISGAVDMLLFYPAGRIMDRMGRTWVAVPSMVILGLGFLLLPLTGSALTLTLVSALMGIGNGIGSGLIMTFGVDIAPPDRRSEFLGAFRLCGDLGSVAGPALVSAVTSLAGLAPALLAMAMVAAVAAAALARWAPRHAPGATQAPEAPT